jgi:hypothetical protein
MFELLALAIVAITVVPGINSQATGAFDAIHSAGLTVDATELTTFDSLAATYMITTPLVIAHSEGPSADIVIDFGDNTYNFNLAASAGMITLSNPVSSITILNGNFVNTNACLIDGATTQKITLQTSSIVTDQALLCSLPSAFELDATPITCPVLL